MPFATDVAYLIAACRDTAQRGVSHSASLILRMIKAYAEARRRSADMEVLRQLDQHLLKDIGMNAHDVRRAILARRAGRTRADGWGA
jgi:uncharacterized protein YjiS (DUF1127 family)